MRGCPSGQVGAPMSQGFFNTVRLVLSAMRPGQFAKNVFVVTPLLFAARLGDGASVCRELVAFLLFCLASGTVYLMNDVVDRHADALHPAKRKRPIASGRLDWRTALAAAAGVGGTTLGAAALWNPPLAGVLAFYLANNVAYSLGGKRIPALDVMIIAVGFVLRVVGGAWAIQVPVSGWIVLCTFLLALYLALGKRVHEVLALGPEEAGTRQVLRSYDSKWALPAFLLVGLAACVAFAAYTLSARAQANFGTSALVYTVPLAVAGLARFGCLVMDRKTARAPTDTLLTDRIALAAVLAWLLASAAIIYFPGGVQ
jgi:4-hydroxybenzoate polyprenyltransferase